MTVAWAQTPSVSAVVNGATYLAGGIAPGELVELAGTNLSSKTVSCVSSAGVAPTTCNSTSVLVNGSAAPLVLVSSTQVNFVVPFGIKGSTATVVVSNNSIQSSAVVVNVVSASPGIFTQNGSATGPGDFLNSSFQTITLTNPASPGSTVQAYAIGLGATNPTITDGTTTPASPPYPTVANVSVTVGGVAAQVIFAGLAPGMIATYLVNFTVPAGLSGNQQVVFTVEGFASNAGVTLAIAAASAQAPTVTGLTNNYSYIAAGLPNYGIAQGSIFQIYGTNLVSSPAPLQSVPLTTTLNGVTVNVTVSGTTTHPILYSLYHGSPDVIDAILPSATPVGTTGTITVTTSAGTSAAFPIVVVQSAFGILTLNEGGTGMAAGFDANNGYAYLGYTAAANPGDAIELWGTGLGPVTGSETVTQTQTPLSNYPIEVDIGGISAQVTYWGRSLYPGLDLIDVIVPQSVVAGCSVSVVVWSKNYNIVSNVATMPVAAVGGRTCSDPTSGLTAAQLQAISGKSSFVEGGIKIGKTTTTTAAITVGPITEPGSTTTNDTISASFDQVTQTQLILGTYGQSVSLGSCTLSTFTGQTPPSQLPQFTPLNAGTIAVTAPNNTTASMTYQNGGYLLSNTSGTLIPAGGGSFSFNNGSGGPGGVGAFTAQLALSTPLVWSNMSSITTVNRSAGVTVKWTGGASGTYVTISGDSIGTVGSNYVGASFTCTAPVSAESFTVPATVLLALPASGTISEGGVSIALGGLVVANSTNPVAFNAPGVDIAFISGSYSSSESVTYQ
jgi:uncharacterized protein (TIGR03437 family)